MRGYTKKGDGSGAAAGGGFRPKLEHYLYSGEKKHVAAGIAVIGVLFGIPWYLMNRGADISKTTLFLEGSKHQSHQDYLERADKARSERLSAGSSLTR
ncbi:UNVERIFIED_CONTAM: hypothetical protein Scaly_1881400 [Sesamum calycinum]|uniref:GAG1At protein n=1 Tax=Sesamum calycinum TaxID=2727403 RepID=A0AAW2NGU2_9LAMI